MVLVQSTRRPLQLQAGHNVSAATALTPVTARSRGVCWPFTARGGGGQEVSDDIQAHEVGVHVTRTGQRSARSLTPVRVALAPVLLGAVRSLCSVLRMTGASVGCALPHPPSTRSPAQPSSGSSSSRRELAEHSLSSGRRRRRRRRRRQRARARSHVRARPRQRQRQRQRPPQRQPQRRRTGHQQQWPRPARAPRALGPARRLSRHRGRVAPGRGLARRRQGRQAAP